MQIKVLLSITVYSMIADLYTASAIGIFDFFSWDANEENPNQRSDLTSESSSRSCICNGPSCICCVDFNFLYVDLGGPGCVQMKYISQEEGMTVNVSYGDSLLHSGVVKGSNPEPTCMPILSSFVELCARFSELKPTEEGLNGCVQLEPKFLGEVQAQIRIGCFSSTPEGMTFNTTSGSNEEVLEDAGNKNNTTNETQELLAVVSESAQQGLSFFDHLLSLAFGNPNSSETQPEQLSNAENSNNTSTSSRSFKKPS